MNEAGDYRAEMAVLAALLDRHGTPALAEVTQFRDWSVEDVIGHLHMFDVGARLSLEDHRDGTDRFAAFVAPVAAALAGGGSLMDVQRDWLQSQAHPSGPGLVAAWREEADRLADLYAATDPRARLAWAGPSMSARSSVTARQMETWAHGHEIFDALDETREEGDRLRNIAHLGVVTRGWAFAVRGLPVPDPEPFVRLDAPSGATWTWGPPEARDRVEGSALGFCQAVTQTRAPADTDMVATGAGARAWMAHPQCFAGPPVDPPAPGSRYRQTR